MLRNTLVQETRRKDTNTSEYHRGKVLILFTFFDFSLLWEATTHTMKTMAITTEVQSTNKLSFEVCD